MLIGEYYHSIDEKGRIMVPVKFRNDFAGKVYITRGLDKCLFVFGEREWNDLYERIKALKMSDATPVIRFLWNGAAEAEFDKQGRILIPQNLREYAGLSKDAVFAGSATRAEIWDKEKWSEYEQTLKSDNIAEIMSKIGL
ncbi:MAG: division/cell wall cluster transcriptional repressor MraZ [Clostridia bacterium]|nr:division/cell wall cluster transcriptional repressor MraZ [Clostridia bacterium]MBR2328222.1 division/cell wall cluster transcriptional repressor MraZ [Clostridia bacterium]